MMIQWREGFEIRVTMIDDEVVIDANREGLLSLSDQLKCLADEPTGSHIHYDEFNALEDGSKQLIITKMNSL